MTTTSSPVAEHTRTVQLVTFELEGHTYCIDVARVQEVLRPQPTTRVPLAPDTVAGLINLRGQVLTAVDLRTQLDLPALGDDKEPMIVVIRVSGGDPIALCVDTIGSVITVDQSQFDTPPNTLRGKRRELILGAYKLPELLLLSLDIDRAIAS